MDPSLCSASVSTNSEEIPSFPSEACHFCSKIFKNVKSRNRHIRNVHKIDVLNYKSTHIICPLCEEETDLKSHEGLRKHLERNHQVSIELLTFEFCSEQEYDRWRDEEKIETNYAKHRAIRKKGYKLLYYDCNRSNHNGYKPNYKKRREKSGGTIKIKGVCPSRMICKFHIEGEVSVKFWKTHVGHKQELRSDHLSKAEEKLIAELLLSGVPPNRILEDSRKLKAPKLAVLTSQDIKNLSRKYNIQNKRDQNDMVAAAMNRATDDVQPQNKRSLQWENLQNFIEGLDDENFTEFMKDIQGTVHKFQEKAYI